jgi:hypothetical protein
VTAVVEPAPPKPLPEQFAALQRWDAWIQWTDAERVEKQVTTSVEDLAEFYNAMLPHAGEIYDYLVGVPIDDLMPHEDRALLCLAIAFAEIADGVEYYSPQSTAAKDMPRFVSAHDSIFGWRR